MVTGAGNSVGPALVSLVFAGAAGVKFGVRGVARSNRYRPTMAFKLWLNTGPAGVKHGAREVARSKHPTVGFRMLRWSPSNSKGWSNAKPPLKYAVQ